MTGAETVKNCVEQLLKYSVDKLSLDKNDVIYVRNSLLDLLGLDSPSAEVSSYGEFQNDIIDPILSYAIENDLTNENEKILFETKLLGYCTPMPSAVISKFAKTYSNSSSKDATDWLFGISKDNNYIRLVDINKNIKWAHNGKFGKIEVTINLSKPEKDPKQIALAKMQKKSGYPACMLCIDNVGYKGNLNHPARQTLRTVPITLGGEPWSLQFSPYQYYDQHVIAFSNVHRPMDVNDACLNRLVDFTEIFPHYFIGSNAALPIVGGSILSHDHYQGGNKVLPMFLAPIRSSYIAKDGDKSVRVSIVDWYNTVVRVESEDKSALLKHASNILSGWKKYSDPDSNILASTNGEPHNAITPIARLENNKTYVLDMILRNNRTDEEHPYGIYHPTEDMHNIKKEGIGIIEVMGTFILPGRLKKELGDISSILSGNAPYEPKSLHSEENPLVKHADMIDMLVNKFGVSNTKEYADKILTDHVNETCEKILECTAVFKNTDKGAIGLDKFMQTVGYVKA